MGISARLQQERKRLGLTQDATAAALGVTKRSVINWEGGSALPGAEALAAYAAAGADVLYILTGQRSQPVPPTATLPPRQRALLDNFEHTDEEGKRHVEQAALLAAKSAAAAKRGKAA